jgi:hypothetical protein
MLEAFQRSAQADEAKRVEAEASSVESPSGGVAGGPFAESNDVPRTASATDESNVSVPLSDEVLGTAPPRAPGMKPRVLLIALAIVFTMAATFLIGRGFGIGSSVRADGDGDGLQEDGALLEDLDTDLGGAAVIEDGPSPPPEELKPAPVSQLTLDDQAFLDANNNWTVIAISFANDDDGAVLATETYRYLREQGMPAVAPITQGKFLVVCVGAEPRRNAAIESVRAQLHRLAGPPPNLEQSPFSSAYFANIEDLIDPRLRR